MAVPTEGFKTRRMQTGCTGGLFAGDSIPWLFEAVHGLAARAPNREQRGRLVLARYCLVPTAYSMAVPTEGFKTRRMQNGLHRWAVRR